MCRRCEREKMAPHAGAASADRDLQPKAFLSSPPSALTSKARRFITGTATMAWILMAALSLQSQFHFGYASGQVATAPSAARRAEGRYLPSAETAHLVEQHDLLHRNLQAPEEEDHDNEEGHHHDDDEEEDAGHAADAAAASGAEQNPDIEGDEHHEHDEEDEGHHEDAVAGTEEEGHEAHEDDHHENDGEVHDDHDDEHEHDEDEATGTAAAAELAEGGADDGHGHTEEDADHDHDHVEMEAEAEGHHDEEEGEHDHHEEEEDEEEGDHDHHDGEEEGDHDHHDEEEGDHDHHDDEEEGDHVHHNDEEGEEHDHDHSEAEAMAASLNADSSSKPWKEVILATLLVNVTALIGVIFLIPAIARSKLCCTALTKRMGAGDRAPPQSAPARSAAAAAGDAERRGRVIDIAVPSFGAGALLAASVFLVLPEAIHLLGKGAASVIAASGDHDGHDGHRVRHLQDDGHGDDEAAIAWKFGTAILGGFLMPIVLGALFPRALEHKCDDECGEAPDLRESPAAAALLGDETELRVPEAIATDHCCHCEVEAADAVPKSIDVEGGAAVIANTSASANDIETALSGADNCPSCHSHSSEKKAGECCADLDHSHHSDGCFGDKDFVDGFADEKAAAKCKHSGKTKTFRRRTRPNINYKLCASILLGDGFHNFADGIFIGIAFLLCSRDVAIAIVAATLYHEMAQELADFFLLTKHAGLSVLWALALNFCSGLFVVLGGVTILSVDGLTAQAVGIILSVAAGVYIHIAASECIPRVDANLHDWKDRLLGILMFVCGAVPIGLVLLNHFHCEG